MLGILLGTALLVSGAATDAEVSNLTFRSKTWDVEIRVPRGWRTVESPSYPQVLFWSGAPDGLVQMVFTAEPAPRSYDDYVKKTKDALVSAGFEVVGPRPHGRSGARLLDIQGKNHVARVAIIRMGKSLFSLSISASNNARLRGELRVFELSLRSLEPL